MKKNLNSIISKPRITIPAFAVIAIIIGAIAFVHVGRAPIISEELARPSKSEAVTPGSNVSLAFPKNGRVESVLVKNGDTVRAGQVLARLSAPDAQGVVSQAKGALDLAQAQFASLNTQYAQTKKQQDLLVQNAYKTLLSTGLEGIPDQQNPNVPVISGTYTCEKEGSYMLKSYASGDSDSGYSLNYSGIESGVIGVKYDNSVALGNCGLQIKFMHVAQFNPNVVWTINIPNTKSSSYLANKNAYDAVVANREKVLSDLSTTIGQNSNSSVAKAQVDAAMGAYQAALGAYQNNVIIAPVNGTINFVDADLKVGQSVISNKPVIGITAI